MSEQDSQTSVPLEELETLFTEDVTVKLDVGSQETAEQEALKFGCKIDVEMTLSCPIGVEYFTKFLKEEYNSENLFCYFDLIVLDDHLTLLQKKKEKEEKEAAVAAVKSFVEKFLTVGAESEVNIRASLRKEAQAGYKQLISSAENEETTEEELAKAIDGAFAANRIVKKEVLLNLTDPFSRYTKSKYFAEIGAIVLSRRANGYDYFKQKIVQASKEHIILNEISFKWTKELKARHPLSVVSSTLNNIVKHLQSLTEAWSWDVDTNTVQLDTKQAVKTSMLDKKLQESAELAGVDLTLLKTPEEKQVFFINVFNLMLIHATVISGGLPQTELLRTSLFRKVKYNIGGDLYSLDDVYNGILRSNPYFGLGKKRISSKDPRAKHILKDVSPLAPFALLTMTTQSPKLRVVQPETLSSDLEELAVEYMNSHVEAVENQLRIAALVKNYASDFDFGSLLGLKRASASTAASGLAIAYVKKSATAPESLQKLKPVFIPDSLVSSFQCLISKETEENLKTSKRRIRAFAFLKKSHSLPNLTTAL